MKREYVTPAFDLIEIEVEDAILNDSPLGNDVVGNPTINPYPNEDLFGI